MLQLSRQQRNVYAIKGSRNTMKGSAQRRAAAPPPAIKIIETPPRRHNIGQNPQPLAWSTRP